MGASNFHSVSGKYFVILPTQLADDDEYNEELDSDLQSEHFNDNIDWIGEQLKEVGFDLGKDDKYDIKALHSYPARLLGVKRSDCPIMIPHEIRLNEMVSIDCQVDVMVIVRSGYYEGMNIDYMVTYFSGGYEYDNITDLINEDMSFVSEEQRDELRAKLTDWFKKAESDLISETEKVLAENTTVLSVFAQFTDGTTMYM